MNYQMSSTIINLFKKHSTHNFRDINKFKIPLLNTNVINLIVPIMDLFNGIIL